MFHSVGLLRLKKRTRSWIRFPHGQKQYVVWRCRLQPRCAARIKVSSTLCSLRCSNHHWRQKLQTLVSGRNPDQWQNWRLEPGKEENSIMDISRTHYGLKLPGVLSLANRQGIFQGLPESDVFSSCWRADSAPPRIKFCITTFEKRIVISLHLK